MTITITKTEAEKIILDHFIKLLGMSMEFTIVITGPAASSNNHWDLYERTIALFPNHSGAEKISAIRHFRDNAETGIKYQHFPLSTAKWLMEATPQQVRDWYEKHGNLFEFRIR